MRCIGKGAVDAMGLEMVGSGVQTYFCERWQ